MRDSLVIGGVALLAAVGGFILAKSGSESGTTSSSVHPAAGNLLQVPAAEPGQWPTQPRRPLPFRDPQETAEEAFQRGLKAVGKSSNPLERYASLAEMLDNLSPETLPEVLKAFKKLPPTAEHANEYRMLLYAWAKFDRAGAIKFIDDITATDPTGGEALTLSQEELLKPVLSAWASQNPKQALDWYSYLPEDQQTHHLKMSLISGWASTDASGAIDYLGTLPRNQDREYLIGQVTSQMFKDGAAQAGSWAEGIEDWSLREQVFEELAEDWVSVDPDGLASWLGDHVDKQYAWEAVEDLGRGWVATDSEAATTWFENLPDGPAKQRGIEKMALSWAENDLLSMGEWLNELPESPVTDRGVKAYSERLLEQAPQAALDSAMSISDNGLRDRTVQELAQEWYATDAEAAVNWASSNSYPEDALGRTLEAYQSLTSSELNKLNKQINRDQLPPEQMASLREQQAVLLEQQAQINAAINAEGGE